MDGPDDSVWIHIGEVCPQFSSNSITHLLSLVCPIAHLFSLVLPLAHLLSLVFAHLLSLVLPHCCHIIVDCPETVFLGFLCAPVPYHPPQATAPGRGFRPSVIVTSRSSLFTKRNLTPNHSSKLSLHIYTDSYFLIHYKLRASTSIRPHGRALIYDNTPVLTYPGLHVPFDLHQNHELTSETYGVRKLYHHRLKIHALEPP